MARIRYTIDENIRFINPYNFVTACFNRKDAEDEGAAEKKEKVSGVLHCELVVKTPLAILDTATVTRNEAGHPTYRFMRIGEKACIPGSSLRGVIRSVYETATQSCFVSLPDSEELLTTRTPASKPYKPGVLKKEGTGWTLYKALRGKITDAKAERTPGGGYQLNASGKLIANGSYVECDWRKLERGFQAIHVRPADVETEYVLFVGEPSNNKKYESVFKIDRNNKCEGKQIEEAFYRLRNTQEYYNDSSVNKKIEEGNHSGYANFRQAEANGCIPVWWNDQNSAMHFSLAAIGRLTFNHSVGDLIGNNGRPCSKRSELCPACDLFGMARSEASVSRVRISDAFSNDAVFTPEPVPLKELGSPRPGYMLFYSKDGSDYDIKGAEIAGRKYYWHIPYAAYSDEMYREKNSENITERNQSCELVNPGAHFLFDIYYDDITKKQLNQLIWTITLGENKEEGDACHKIGHGKPLGLGSVKLFINSIEQRSYHLNSGYNITSNEAIEDKLKLPDGFFSQTIIRELQRICDFSFLKGEKVCYPHVDAGDIDLNTVKENELANHIWYSENKRNNKNAMTLPGILADDPTLPVYKAVTVERKSSGDRSLGTANSKRMGAKRTTYQIDMIYEGKVTGHNRSGWFAYVEMQNGGRASFRDDSNLPEGTSVKLEYKGKKEGGDGRIYDQWEKVR